VFLASAIEFVKVHQEADGEFSAGMLDPKPGFTALISREELELTPDLIRRRTLLSMLEGLVVHPLTVEMKTLARHYVENEVFALKVFNDALHVASAVLTRQDVLVSWNFKHLANRQRRAKINMLNISLGLPTIEIVPPPEV
jgi:hypothetical protein